MPEAATRASDADRDRLVEELRVHAGAGRLGVEELEDRVEAALAARTHGELAALRQDLPHRRRHPGRARRSLTRFPLELAVLLVGIWALTGAGYFWPVWPLLGVWMCQAPCSWRVHRTSR